MSRDELMEYLRRKGIDTRPIFYPLHVMPPYHRGERYPVGEYLSAHGISLPTSYNLTAEQVTYIAETLRAVMEH